MLLGLVTLKGRRETVIPDQGQCILWSRTQNAAGVTSSLSKLELDRTKTARLPRRTLPISTPSSKNSAPPLDEMFVQHCSLEMQMAYSDLHNVMDHIVFESDEVTGVDVHSSVECLMDRWWFDVRWAHVAVHVKVNWISTETESLTSVEDLGTRFR